MDARKLRLSKSRFTAGLQCAKLLWWKTHERDAPELIPDPSMQAIFDQGNRVGEFARTCIPGGVLIDLPHTAIAERLEATRVALDGRAPAIYEASFFADDVFVAVDILVRTGRSFSLVEVKSSTRVKDEHLPDAAIQAYVVRASGLPLSRVEIMHLNRECCFPDLSNLFTRVDVTRAVAALEPGVPAQVRAQLQALAGPLPDVAVGDHCSSPYLCPFHDRCWPELPAHHVSTLYFIGRGAGRLVAEGYTTLHDLPDDLPMKAAAARQVRAVREDRLIVEPMLGPALHAFSPPLAFLDFETVAPAIPVWPGCHPYDQIPVQFSCHLEREPGAWVHREWLAEGPGDPRAEFADQLIGACRGARSIVAYNASFEKRCVEALAQRLPERATELNAIRAKLVDALPLVRDHVYHPDFGGSFSLKAVLPALVPELSYAGLTIGDGTAASQALARLLFESDGMDREERQRVRAALLEYCKLDTWAMVRLLDRLQELAGSD
jgi:predicted RecB family nuclease